MKFPIAVPMTDAFHVRMNKAPAPYRKEKSIQKTNTLRLLKNIVENALTWLTAFGASRVFIFRMVSACVLKSRLVRDEGSITYQMEKANTKPMKRKRNVWRALP